MFKRHILKNLFMAKNRVVTDEDIALMRELREEGKSYRDIGQALHVSHTTVRSYLVFGSSVEFNRSVAMNNGHNSTAEYQAACREARGFNTDWQYRRALREKRK
jgi:hypothetical protein